MSKYTTDSKIPQEMFEFVQFDEKIYDKKFETKPVGYFKDAMIRFAKNKTNVVATTILFTLILLSIFVPILTKKNYTVLEHELQLLPPRIPLLEKFGIADGKKTFKDQTVDLSTIDPETGLGYPEEIDPKYIIPGTLKNYTQPCTNINVNCKGGEVVLTINSSLTEAILESSQTFPLNKGNNSTLEVEIVELTEGSTIYVEVMVAGQSVVLKEITKTGVHTITFSEVEGVPNMVISKLRLRVKNEEVPQARMAVKSVKQYINNNEEPMIDHEGYPLSQYLVLQNSGTKARENGKILKASFRYDAYSAALYSLKTTTISEEQLLNEYAKGCKIIEETKTDNSWEYEDGCIIKRVTDVIPQNFKGTILYDYEVQYEYGKYKGFDSMPYFLFGTTAAGKDYFALVWLGLRTSLLLGVIVATINIVIGVIYGAIEGYYGGLTDLLMERFGEILGRIPWLVWLSLFIIIFGTGFKTIILLLTVTGWLGIASVTRTQFYRYKGREYVLASRTLGASDARLIFRHILPNGIGTLITASILSIPSVIFSESTVSYLGYGIGAGQNFKILGIQLSGESLGVIMANAREFLTSNPYLTLFPAIIISILMITFNMFGNALRDAFNPSLRGSE